MFLRETTCGEYEHHPRYWHPNLGVVAEISRDSATTHVLLCDYAIGRDSAKSPFVLNRLHDIPRSRVSKVGGRHHPLVSRKCHHRARLVESCPTVCRPPTDSTDSTVNQCTPFLRGCWSGSAALATSFGFSLFSCDGPAMPRAPSSHARPARHLAPLQPRRTPLRDRRGPVTRTRPKSAAIDGRVTSSALHLSWWS